VTAAGAENSGREEIRMRYRKNGLAAYKRRGKALKSGHQGAADCPLADVLGIAQVPEQAENNESSGIYVHFKVVGRREWLEGKILRSAFRPEQRVEIANASDLQAIKDSLDKQTIHGFDIVTTGKNDKDGLDPLSDTSKIVLVQYGTREMVYLIEPDLILEFKNLLQSEKHLKIGHNILVDFEFILANFGLPIVRMYDTMLAEQLLTAGLENVSVGLKDLARKYPPHHQLSNSLRDDFFGFCEDGEDGKFTKEMLRKAAREVHVLFPVSEGQWCELREHGLEDVARDEFRCIPVTADIELYRAS
jgi:DNA polymerase I-like protein with 3'-5' exonuclease and polymerase domains